MKKGILISAIALLALAMALPQNALAQGAGKALTFDGTDDYVNLGDFDSNNGGNTFEFWLNPDAISDQQDFFSKFLTGSEDGRRNNEKNN